MPLAGEIIDANDVPGDWSTYTPTLLGSTSGGTIGNGTLVARYVRLGDLVVAQVDLVWGSTTSAGTGTALLSLPVAARAVTPGHIGTFIGLDTSAGANGRYSPGGVIPNTVNDVLVLSGAALLDAADEGAIMSGTVPVTWATGDSWRYTMFYEAA